MKPSETLFNAFSAASRSSKILADLPIGISVYDITPDQQKTYWEAKAEDIAMDVYEQDIPEGEQEENEES